MHIRIRYRVVESLDAFLYFRYIALDGEVLCLVDVGFQHTRCCTGLHIDWIINNARTKAPPTRSLEAAAV